MTTPITPEERERLSTRMAEFLAHDRSLPALLAYDDAVVLKDSLNALPAYESALQLAIEALAVAARCPRRAAGYLCVDCWHRMDGALRQLGVMKEEE